MLKINDFAVRSLVVKWLGEGINQQGIPGLSPDIRVIFSTKNLHFP